MDATLTRYRTILQFRIDDVLRDEVTFWQEEIEGSRPIRAFRLDRECWLELGQPRLLTLTVEPGDLLNMEG